MEDPHSYIESLKKTISDQALTEEKLREQIRRLSQEAERLEEFKSEMNSAFESIMDETCGKNEKHCTCVPILRLKAKVQQEEISNLSAQLEEREKEIEGWQNK